MRSQTSPSRALIVFLFSLTDHETGTDRRQRLSKFNRISWPNEEDRHSGEGLET